MSAVGFAVDVRMFLVMKKQDQTLALAASSEVAETIAGKSL